MKALKAVGLQLAACASLGTGIVLDTAITLRGQSQTPAPNPGAVIRDTDDGVKYARGQNVVPVYEGWVPNPDGTFSLVFGAWNRNWEETVHIPIGPDNFIEPGPADQGQPTYFVPRRGKNLFEIIVPKDFAKKEVVWTIRFRGKTEKAFAGLVPQEVITRRMVLLGGSLSVAAAAGDDNTGDESDPNKPPVVTVDASAKSAPMSDGVSLTASVSDDGYIPTGRPGRGGARAMRVVWSTYRGPAGVTFEPRQSDVGSLTGGTVTAQAIFKAPGTYRLRATAIDAANYEVHNDVDVEVK